MFRPTKRQRLENPLCWMDCEALTAVPALPPPQKPQQRSSSIIRSTVASPHQKELFLDRLRNEIVQRMGFTLTRSRAERDEGPKSPLLAAAGPVLKQRIRIGTNTCTRALEKAAASTCQQQQQQHHPVLVVVAAEDVSPVTPLVHIPVLAEKAGCPLLLLPGSASFELGRALSANKVSVMTFFSEPPNCSSSGGDGDAEMQDENNNPTMTKNLHGDLDSFIEFILTKTCLQHHQR